MVGTARNHVIVKCGRNVPVERGRNIARMFQSDVLLERDRNVAGTFQNNVTYLPPWNVPATFLQRSLFAGHSVGVVLSGGIFNVMPTSHVKSICYKEQTYK